MRILNINKFYYMRGGAERYYFALTKLLESNGHEVIPFSMQDDRNFPSKYSKYFVSNLEVGKPGLRMVNQIGRSFWSRETKTKLASLLDEVKPDVAHLHLIYHHLSPSLLPELKKRKIPVVMTLHDYKLICPNYLLYTEGNPCERCRGHRYYNAVIHKCLKRSYPLSAFAALEMSAHKLMQVYEKNIDLFIAPSQFVKQEYVKFGQDPAKITVVPHFIDPAFLQAADRAGSEAAQSEPYALFFGRLSQEKGIDKLLEAIYIYKPHLHLQLHIAGTGPMEAWIKSYIETRGLQDRVKMLGHLNTEQLISAVRSAAVVVIPSRVYETFGFSALESIALGTPVVAYAMGGLSEIITPEVGRLVPLDEVSSLAKAMTELATWDRAKTRAAGRELITSRYTPQRHLESLMTLYSHL